MSERDAFGREVGDEDPEVTVERQRTGGGPPRWLYYLVAMDLVIAIAVVAYFVA